MMKANPRHAHFRKVLEATSHRCFSPWEGDCWRCQDAAFPSARQILSGKGARSNGGRLNAMGTFAVVYGSTDDHTAMEESAARAKRYGLILRSPRILVCIRFKLQRVLDLTKPDPWEDLGTSEAEMEAEDWEKIQENSVESVGQALGRAAKDAGAEAVLLPSFARPGGVNLAYFPENRIAGSKVKIWDAGKLPASNRRKRRR